MSDPIASALDNPVPAPALAEPGDAVASPHHDGLFERPKLDKSCPVKPLGILSDISGSQRCYYLDTNGQIVGLEAGNRHSKNAMIALFGTQSDWLEAHYPQWSKPVTEYDRSTKTHTIIKPSEIVGFDQAEASRALIEECNRRGIFDPAGKMRGRGAHLDRKGGLILHCGDKVLATQHRVDGAQKGWRWTEPGLYDGYVYPTAAPIPRPLDAEATSKPAEKLLGLLMTWQWKRPLLDPRFLLGWIGAAMVGGALHWRPNVWITGGPGTGKSTLNGEGKLLHQLFGDGLLTTAEASAAAIRQILKNSTVPVLFDEIEASEDNRRVSDIVALARVSSSGAKVHRGGQDHTAHEFTLRSCFQFSSINIPPIEPQDRSRLGILELKPFPPESVAPDLDSYHLPALGDALRRRMVDGWARMPQTLLAFQRALTKSGHTARAADQFGTLLACAHILLEDDLPDDEEVAEWAGLCDRGTLAEISEATADHTACLQHLLTSTVQARGGDEREVLGTWVGRAVAAACSELGDIHDKSGERLQQLGLKLVNAKLLEAGARVRWGAQEFIKGQPGFLAIAGSHQALAGLFQGTKWQGGVWRQSLARQEGAVEPVKVKMARQAATAVLVPLWAVLDDSELPEASKPEAAAAWMAAQLEGAA